MVSMNGVDSSAYDKDKPHNKWREVKRMIQDSGKCRCPVCGVKKDNRVILRNHFWSEHSE